ncbi:phospholipase D/nuclease [Clavulina sp. PMI_390]|nr:phospholipase D/nuclease [Clavulina sp. PMI_390]
MSRFLHKLKDKVEDFAEDNKGIEKLRLGVERAVDTVTGIANPNHRHDEAWEQEQDRVRTEICDSHRFQSFAADREQNQVKWHIAGHDYFWAVSEVLDSAKDHIFILDWWLTPELYLRRPPAYFPEWRLDRLLKRKAEEGVMVYVIVYKEVTETMTMSSRHTKHALEGLHKNITVMRHPDHIGAVDSVEFWSHHEKVVVVDNFRACIGGLDLCFGRYDTTTHPLADAHPTQFYKTLFPGQDYNDARFADFEHVDDFASNKISVAEQPRMPWQDCHMTIIGPSVLDVSQHFIERWNEVKKRKYRGDPAYEWLALPHDVESGPNEAIVRHPHREAWLAVGRQYKQRWFGEEAPPPKQEGHGPYGNMRVQVVRSVSDWSHGVLTEHSIQNAYKQLIMEARHFIYIENQFFISNTEEKGAVKNTVAKALLERILLAAQSGTKFKVIVVIPEATCFAGPLNTTSISTILAAQYRTMNRGGHSLYEGIQKAGYDPMEYIRFYHLRTYDRINAPWSFIREMESRSGVTWEQAQVALARQWLGPDDDSVDFEVTIKSPEPTQAEMESLGRVKKDNPNDEIKKVKVPATYEEAVRIVKQFESGATRSDEEVADTVGQHVQKDQTSLHDEKWLGSTIEEKAGYVSELVYIHSKLMIVDDTRVIMGSANLNDRSQRGDGDSEIALVVEDLDMVETQMDGKRFMASRFAASLRMKLFRQHLGLVDPQFVSSDRDPVTPFMRPSPIPGVDEFGLPETQKVLDPLSDEFQELWNNTAKVNSEVYHELWKPVPSNNVNNWETYKSYVPKVVPGHLADESVPIEYLKNRLALVRGHLVEAQLDFLKDDKGWTSDDSLDWKGMNPTLPIYI